MTTPSPRSRSFQRILLPVLALSLSAASAEASEVICEGSLRLADCSPAGQVPWSVASQPTFIAKCKPCPSPNPSLDDGGTPTCGPWAPADPSQFMIFGPNTTPGTHPLDFERAGSCGDETLFRYVGPLVAGNYDIWLNSNPHSYALRLTVVGAAPAADAGASGPDAGVAADVASGVDGAADGDADPGSCACVAVRGRDRRLDARSLTLLLLVSVGVVVSRRASPRRSA